MKKTYPRHKRLFPTRSVMRVPAAVRLATAAAVIGGLSMALPPAALAQQAGTATDVNATARALDAAGAQARLLVTRGAVFSGDVITTDATGQAQIQFADDTRMVIGPNARLTIDRFVFDSSATASEVAIGTVRGAFRFITGVSSKQAYTIRFPAGTIGVRGTQLDIVVDEDGTGKIALYEGAIRVCDDSTPRRCTVIEEPCTLLMVRPEGTFEWVQNLDTRTRMLEAEFPYAFGQQRVQRLYWVSSGGCDQRDYNRTPQSRDTGGAQPEVNYPDAPPEDEDDEEDGEGIG